MDSQKNKYISKACQFKEEINSYELRLKRLLEFSKVYKDKKLMSALGIITTDYIDDKNALPLSVYRLRKIVDDIRSKAHEDINSLARQFSIFMRSPDYLTKFGPRIKLASKCKKSIFRRIN